MDWLNNWLNGIFVGAINTMWGWTMYWFDRLAGLVTNNVLVEFRYLLGTNLIDYKAKGTYWSDIALRYETGYTSAQGTAVSVFTEVINNVIGSLAFAVLTIVILIQFIKIAQRMDANQMIPAVKEMVMLVVFCVIIISLVNYSTTIMRGIYDLCNSVGSAFDSALGETQLDTGAFLIGESLVDEEGAITIMGVPNKITLDIAALLCFAFIMIIVMVATFIIMIICSVVSLARGLQILVLYTFAPLMFAFLGLDETRQWSVGYLKNFAAACLAGAIMVVVVRLFPFIIVGYASVTPVSSLAGVLVFLVQVLAAAFLVAMACMKAGSWANAIFGG